MIGIIGLGIIFIAFLWIAMDFVATNIRAMFPALGNKEVSVITLTILAGVLSIALGVWHVIDKSLDDYRAIYKTKNNFMEKDVSQQAEDLLAESYRKAYKQGIRDGLKGLHRGSIRNLIDPSDTPLPAAPNSTALQKKFEEQDNDASAASLKVFHSQSDDTQPIRRKK